MSALLGNTDTQLKTAYEVEGMTPSEIADDMGYAVEAVKAKLMQVSSKYRKACGSEGEKEDKLNFSDEQLAVVNEELFLLATQAESEKVRANLLKYIRDDKKGRKDVVKGVGNVSFNLLQFNEAIVSSRANAQAAKAKIGNIVELEKAS